jgi:LysM repeat protein
MALMEKYKDTLDLTGTHIGADLSISEEGGKLLISGTAPHALDMNTVWDSIKTHAGWENEIQADIKVGSSDIYGRYTVQKGDTLSKIAIRFLGKPGRYTEIFEANKDVLKDPDVIHPGQVLTIPKQ